jgi:hypothetical protein
MNRTALAFLLPAIVLASAPRQHVYRSHAVGNRPNATITTWPNGIAWTSKNTYSVSITASDLSWSSGELPPFGTLTLPSGSYVFMAYGDKYMIQTYVVVP